MQSNSFDMTHAIPLPIPQSAIDTANRFAQQQPNPEKAQQVRLNTLAVSVMYDYLTMMGVSANYSGDSWNPVTRLMADVADLEISGAGRLECRPTLANVATCTIPPEVWEDRLGYVVVQIDEPQQQAYLLGFVERAQVETLPINQLQPPEDLLDHVDRLLHPATSTAPLRVAMGEGLTTLSQWFQDIFESGWESLETLLNPPDAQLSYGFRRAVPSASPERLRRAKRIPLGDRSPDQSLLLLVELLPVDRGDVLIWFQLRHALYAHIPPGTELRILDDTEAVFAEAASRPGDNYLQLEISASSQEAFAVQIRSGEDLVSERFVV